MHYITIHNSSHLICINLDKITTLLFYNDEHAVVIMYDGSYDHQIKVPFQDEKSYNAFKNEFFDMMNN